MPATDTSPERQAAIEARWQRCDQMHPQMTARAVYEVGEGSSLGDLDSKRAASVKAVGKSFMGELYSTPNSRMYWDQIRSMTMNLQKFDAILDFLNAAPHLANFQLGRDHAILHIARILLIDLRKIQLVSPSPKNRIN